MRVRLLAAALAVAIVLGACGGDDAASTDGEDNLTGPLAPVERSLDEVESGRIDLAFLANAAEGEPVGFEMEGPFSVAQSGDEVPVADLTYTQRIGPTSTETRFLADGEDAWVVTPERTVQVEGDRLDSLKGGEDVSGLQGLHPTTWFEGEVEEAPGEAVGGDDTVRYSGEVDAIAVLNDIVGLAGNLGAEAPSSLEGEDAERVRKAVESSSLEVLAGSDDDILRKVAFEVNLSAGENLNEVLGDLAGVTLRFEFELTEVNEEVEAPAAPDGAVTTTTRDKTEGPRVTVVEPDEGGGSGGSGGAGDSGDSTTSTTSNGTGTGSDSSTTSTTRSQTTTTGG